MWRNMRGIIDPITLTVLTWLAIGFVAGGGLGYALGQIAK